MDTDLTELHFLRVRDDGWQIDPRMKIDSVQATINGNFINRLNPFECDMMYVTQKELHVCRDNFRWEFFYDYYKDRWRL